MKVCVLCNDLSCAGVMATGVADALSGDNEVVIVGAQFREELWPSLTTSNYRIVAVRIHGTLDFLTRLPKLIASLDCDVVVCCKACFTSLLPALLNRLIRGTPVVLYVTDDEVAQTHAGRSLPLRRRLLDPTSDLYARLAHRLSRYVKVIISDTSAMQRTYGGSLVPLPRDLSHFDPHLFDRAAIRSEFNVRDVEFLVGFIGVPRPHKGIDDLLEAVAIAELPTMRVWIVPPIGFSDDDLLARISRFSGRVQMIENEPSSRVPPLLAACDAVVIPQRQTPEARAQLPAKLYEAMAMGKAIVATTVSDMPLYLHDCGILVPPSDPLRLAAALRRLASDVEYRDDLGRRARLSYQQRLGVETVRPKFLAAVESALPRALAATHR